MSLRLAAAGLTLGVALQHSCPAEEVRRTRRGDCRPHHFAGLAVDRRWANAPGAGHWRRCRRASAPPPAWSARTGCRSPAATSRRRRGPRRPHPGPGHRPLLGVLPLRGGRRSARVRRPACRVRHRGHTARPARAPSAGGETSTPRPDWAGMREGCRRERYGVSSTSSSALSGQWLRAARNGTEPRRRTDRRYAVGIFAPAVPVAGAARRTGADEAVARRRHGHRRTQRASGRRTRAVTLRNLRHVFTIIVPGERSPQPRWRCSPPVDDADQLDVTGRRSR